MKIVFFIQKKVLKALEEEERESKASDNKIATPERYIPPHQPDFQKPQFQKPQQYQPQVHQFQPQFQKPVQQYQPQFQKTSQVQQQQQHNFRLGSSNTVPSKTFQMLERKYSIESDGGSDSPRRNKNNNINEDSSSLSKGI
jgi:hypothetical protein